MTTAQKNLERARILSPDRKYKVVEEIDDYGIVSETLPSGMVVFRVMGSNGSLQMSRRTINEARDSVGKFQAMDPAHMRRSRHMQRSRLRR